jgi:hypothetical protein
MKLMNKTPRAPKSGKSSPAKKLLSPFAGGKAPGAPMSDKDMAKQGMPAFKHGGKVKKPKY